MKKIKDKEIPPSHFVANYEMNDYDYSQFWQGRQYEDIAERMLLRKLFRKYIKNQNTKNIVDIGGAYGRLSEFYKDTFKSFMISDYSTHELEHAAKTLEQYNEKMKLVAANAYHLPFCDSSIDSILSVRLIHHIATPELMIQEISRVLKPDGTLILEVAHKHHVLALLRAIFTGKVGEYLTNRPHHISHKQDAQGIKEGQVSIIYAFSKFHIKSLIEKNNMELVEIASCSFFRSNIIKKIVPIQVLIFFEGILQNIFGWAYSTPSLFFVARKKNGTINENNEIFCCPICKGKLIQESSRYFCNHCQKEFTVNKVGIVDFREPRPEAIDF